MSATATDPVSNRPYTNQGEEITLKDTDKQTKKNLIDFNDLVSNPLSIKKCNKPDEQTQKRILEINQQVGLGKDFNPFLIKQYFQGNAPRQIFIARKLNTIVGYLLMRPFHEGEGYKGLILAVDPNYQKQKVGTYLIKEAFRYLEKQKIAVVQLNCQEKNINFYKRFTEYPLKLVKNDNHPLGDDYHNITYFLAH